MSGARTGILPALAAAAAGSVVLACFFGPMDIPASEAFAILASPLTGQDFDPARRLVVLDLRLARSTLAFLVGAALASSGAAFQGLLRNPLADPFTLGVSTGAAFGASLAISLGLAAPAALAGLGVLPVAALAGALATLAGVLLLARSAGGLRRETLVLSGIIASAMLAALISLVKSLNEESVAGIVFWIMGSLQGRGWEHVGLMAPYALLGLAAATLLGRELDILALGETQAAQLGVRVGRVRLILLTAASLSAAAAVAVSGVIGFVGLAVPHLLRLAGVVRHRLLVPASALLGGSLLLWSDVLARSLLPHGAELPVGVVTALLGGPFFCLLLRRGAAGGRP